MHEAKTSKEDYMQIYKKNPDMPLREWAESWYGRSLDYAGNLLTEYNPLSKWDWYEIGGRWAGQFILKEGIEPTAPNFSWGWSKDDKLKVISERRVDQALKRDIDFDAMKTLAKKEAKSRYERVAKALGGVIPKLDFTWQELLDDASLEIDQKREKYHNQKAKKLLDRATNTSTDSELRRLLAWLDLEDYQCTKEEYIKRAEQSFFTTWAVLDEKGEWHEAGQMGWFGISDASKEDEEQFQGSYFDRFIKDLPEDTLLTVVDCHI